MPTGQTVYTFCTTIIYVNVTLSSDTARWCKVLEWMKYFWYNWCDDVVNTSECPHSPEPYSVTWVLTPLWRIPPILFDSSELAACLLAKFLVVKYESVNSFAARYGWVLIIRHEYRIELLTNLGRKFSRSWCYPYYVVPSYKKIVNSDNDGWTHPHLLILAAVAGLCVVTPSRVPARCPALASKTG